MTHQSRYPRARILVIDDAEAIRTLVQRVLGLEGYEVHVAPDGRTGVMIWRALGADLVMTDLRMPDMDGFQTILQLRATGPLVPIIVCSGGNPVDDLRALQAVEGIGPVSCLGKPFTVVELLEAIQAALKPS